MVEGSNFEKASFLIKSKRSHNFAKNLLNGNDSKGTWNFKNSKSLKRIFLKETNTLKPSCDILFTNVFTDELYIFTVHMYTWFAQINLNASSTQLSALSLLCITTC